MKILREIKQRIYPLRERNSVVGSFTPFSRDIYNDKLMTPHQEMMDCVKAYNDNSFFQSAINTMVDFIMGGGLVIKSDDPYSKKMCEAFIDEIDADQWLREAIENTVKTGNGYVEMDYEIETGIPRKFYPISDSSRMYINCNEYGEPIEKLEEVTLQNGEKTFKNVPDPREYFVQKIDQTVRNPKAKRYSISYQFNGYMNYYQIYGIPIDMRKMIHFKLNIGDTGIYGRSYMASALNDNEALKQMEQSIAVIARHKAIPRKLINYGDPNQPATSNELDDFVDYMSSLQKDEDIVVNKPTKIEEFSYAGGEINLDYMIQHTRKKIVAGIAPEFVMGMADQVNYSTAQVQLLAYVLSIYSKRKIFLKTLQRKVLDPFIKHNKLKQSWPDFGELNFEGPKEKQERIMQLWKDNITTLKQTLDDLEIPFEGTDEKYLDMRYVEFNNANAPEMPDFGNSDFTSSLANNEVPPTNTEEVTTGNSGDLTYTILDKRVKKEPEANTEAISIPIEEGDTLLGGKFRNKKIVVKDISENERGEPLVNGKPILNVRLTKKMPESYSLDSDEDYEESECEGCLKEENDDEVFPKNPTGTKSMAYKYAIEIRKRFRDAYNKINKYIDQNKQKFQESIMTEAVLPIQGIETILSSLGVAVNELIPIVEQYTKMSWMKANYDIAKRLKMGNSIPFNQQILQMMMKNQMGWIEKYGKEKETQLRTSLTEGITQGDSISTIKKEIKDILQTTAHKSETIARSETIRTYNMSALESMKQSGVVENVRYLTAHDDRVCSICRPLHNKVWPINSNQIKMPVKDTHPNCRCSISSAMQDDSYYKDLRKDDKSFIDGKADYEK